MFLNDFCWCTVQDRCVDTGSDYTPSAGTATEVPRPSDLYPPPPLVHLSRERHLLLCEPFVPSLPLPTTGPPSHGPEIYYPNPFLLFLPRPVSRSPLVRSVPLVVYVFVLKLGLQDPSFGLRRCCTTPRSPVPGKYSPADNLNLSEYEGSESK